MECFEKSWLLKMIDHLKTFSTITNDLWCPLWKYCDAQQSSISGFPSSSCMHISQHQTNPQTQTSLACSLHCTSPKELNCWVRLRECFRKTPFQPINHKSGSQFERVFFISTKFWLPLAISVLIIYIYMGASLRVLINSKDIIPPKNYTRIPVWSSLMCDKSLQGLA